MANTHKKIMHRVERYFIKGKKGIPEYKTQFNFTGLHPTHQKNFDMDQKVTLSKVRINSIL